jgi:hypothetical protein
MALAVNPGMTRSASFEPLNLPHSFMLQLLDQEGAPIEMPVHWRFQHALVDVEPFDLARGLWHLRASHSAFKLELQVLGFTDFSHGVLFAVDENTMIPIVLQRLHQLEVSVVNPDGSPFAGRVRYNFVTPVRDSERFAQYFDPSLPIELHNNQPRRIRFENDQGEVQFLDVDPKQLPWFSKHQVTFSRTSRKSDGQPGVVPKRYRWPEVMDDRLVLKGTMVTPDGSPLARRRFSLFNLFEQLLVVVDTDEQGRFSLDVSAWQALLEGKHSQPDIAKAPWLIRMHVDGLLFENKAIRIAEFYQKDTVTFPAIKQMPVHQVEVRSARGEVLPDATFLQTSPFKGQVALDANGRGQALSRHRIAVYDGAVYRDGFVPFVFEDASNMEDSSFTVYMEPAAKRTFRFKALKDGVHQIQFTPNTPNSALAKHPVFGFGFTAFLEGDSLTLSGLPMGEFSLKVTWGNQKRMLKLNTLAPAADAIEIDLSQAQAEAVSVKVLAPDGKPVFAGRLRYASWTPEDRRQEDGSFGNHPVPGKDRFRPDFSEPEHLPGVAEVDALGVAQIGVKPGTDRIWLFYNHPGVGCFNGVLELPNDRQDVRVQTLAFAEVKWQIQPRIGNQTAYVLIENEYLQMAKRVDLTGQSLPLFIKNVPPGANVISMMEKANGVSDHQTYVVQMDLQAREQVVLQDDSKHLFQLQIRSGKSQPFANQLFEIEAIQDDPKAQMPPYQYKVMSDAQGQVSLDYLPPDTYRVRLALEEQNGVSFLYPEQKIFRVKQRSTPDVVNFRPVHDVSISVPQVKAKNFYVVFWEPISDVVFRIEPRETVVYELRIPEGKYHVFTQASKHFRRAHLVATQQTLLVDGKTQAFNVITPAALAEAQSATLRTEDLRSWAWASIFRLDENAIWQPYALIKDTKTSNLPIKVHPGEYAILNVTNYGLDRAYASGSAGEDILLDTPNRGSKLRLEVILDKGEKIIRVEQLTTKEQFAPIHVVNNDGMAMMFTNHYHVSHYPGSEQTNCELLLPEIGDFEFTIRSEQGIDRQERVQVDKDTKSWDLR